MVIIRYISFFLIWGLGLSVSYAHGITGADQEFLINNVGPQIGPFIYLGAKHMVTGYDHLLFLAGVLGEENEALGVSLGWNAVWFDMRGELEPILYDLDSA